MAKKGQIFKKYTPEFRKEVVERYLKGEGSAMSLGTEYGISKKTIETWIRAFKQQIPIGMQKKGRPKEENIDYREKYEILKKYQAFLRAQREKK